MTVEEQNKKLKELVETMIKNVEFELNSEAKLSKVFKQENLEIVKEIYESIIEESGS